jgi:hypothetical protein
LLGIIDNDLVAMFHQSARNIAAHAAQSDDGKLHNDHLFMASAMATTSDSIPALPFAKWNRSAALALVANGRIALRLGKHHGDEGTLHPGHGPIMPCIRRDFQEDASVRAAFASAFCSADPTNGG